MGMNLGSGGSADGDIISDINTTPLIDVMLVLLIMLIITIPIQLHAVNLNLPTGNPPPPEKPPEVVRIDIQADGNVLWNGESVAGEPALEAKLQATAAVPEQPEVHLRPDRAVDYEVVARVLAAAQREGVTKLGVVGSEQFLP
jgi:biopolymer transport protein ExbD